MTDLVRLFDLVCSPGGYTTYDRDVQAKVVEDPEFGRVLIFQGTNVDYNPKTGFFYASLPDLLIDAQMWPDKKTGFPAGMAKIHGTVIDIFLDSKCNLVTGWSLGGMCAQLCNGAAPIYTFGAPAVYPIHNPLHYTKTLNVVHQYDSLIKLYPKFLYRRPGATLLIGSGKPSLMNHSMSVYAQALRELP